MQIFKIAIELAKHFSKVISAHRSHKIWNLYLKYLRKMDSLYNIQIVMVMISICFIFFRIRIFFFVLAIPIPFDPLSRINDTIIQDHLLSYFINCVQKTCNRLAGE
jgi:hypothetical protein